MHALRAPYAACAASAALILFGSWPATARAEWLTFVGGPVNAVGTWPATGALAGTATATASNFVNGNNSTPAIGITPLTIPNLSPDYFATGLVPNAGNVVTSLGAPYNDAADTYHVVFDFSGTTSSSSSGVLPAGSVFAIIDLDIDEVFLQVKATDAASNLITTPWINNPNTRFDMNLPMIAQGSLGAPPTLIGPTGGVYDMIGINWNYDAGMWLFNTTQDVKTIEFDMAKNSGGNQIGGGGGGWAFYSPHVVPEPASLSLVGCGLLALLASARHGRRNK
jgi:hypothetical protein